MLSYARLTLEYCVEQKWSKGKQKEKVNAAVFFDKNLYEKLKKEVPSYKLITPSIISERMRWVTEH